MFVDGFGGDLRFHLQPIKPVQEVTQGTEAAFVLQRFPAFCYNAQQASEPWGEAGD
jgi:hypothetical protein